MKKVCILRKFRAKIAVKRRALRDVTMLLLMTSLAKEREIAVKVLYNDCHIGKFIKWLYEWDKHVINMQYVIITVRQLCLAVDQLPVLKVDPVSRSWLYAFVAIWLFFF